MSESSNFDNGPTHTDKGEHNAIATHCPSLENSESIYSAVNRQGNTHSETAFRGRGRGRGRYALEEGAAEGDQASTESAFRGRGRGRGRYALEEGAAEGDQASTESAFRGRGRGRDSRQVRNILLSTPAVGNPALASYPNGYAGPTPAVGNPALASYPNGYAGPTPAVGNPALASYPPLATSPFTFGTATSATVSSQPPTTSSTASTFAPKPLKKVSTAKKNSNAGSSASRTTKPDSQESEKKPVSYVHGNSAAAVRKQFPVIHVENPVGLEDLGVVLTDVMSFLPIKELIPFLAASVEVHQWYDTCVEFRMAVAYTDAPYKQPGGMPNVCGDTEAQWYRSLPTTKPRWDYAPINFEQHSAGYLQNDELAPSQRKPMKVVPEVSYFNLRSLCCSTMVSQTSGLRTQATKLTIDDDTKGDDYYDATNSLDAGDYLLAGLVAKHVVIKSTGGISSIGRGFLRSTTAHTVTIAADRYTGSNVCAPRSIGSGWFGDCRNLRRLDCAGLDYVEEVGPRWLERSGELESVSFTGLRNLRKVGESWLHACPKLAHVDFSGLGNLTDVDGWWLRDCGSLEVVDFKGLRSLKSVGGRWLERCGKLRRTDTSDLICLYDQSDDAGRVFKLDPSYVPKPAPRANPASFDYQWNWL